jgi:hypothetical protein
VWTVLEAPASTYTTIITSFPLKFAWTGTPVILVALNLYCSAIWALALPLLYSFARDVDR